MPQNTRRDLRRALHRLAAAQSGYFTAAQALKAGYSYQAQRYHVEHNNWTRMERGIFRLHDWPSGDHDDLVLWTLWSRNLGVVSHDTAIAVHGLGDLNPAAIHLTVPLGFRASARGLVLHRAKLPENDVEIHSGYRITTPVRSILDVAAHGIEGGRLANIVTDALERGLTSPRALRERGDAFGAAAALRIDRALSGIGR